MLDRRTLNMSLGALVAGAFAAPAAKARIAFATPDKGPWTGGGLLRRAGGVLHYATLGDEKSTKPPIILLHKLGGWLSDWRHVAPALAEGRRVIAFDFPGHGDSKWDGAPPYIQSLAETAALIVGALNEMGIGQIDLIGTSLGGCVSVPLAAYFPERIHRLALVSCALTPQRTLAEIATAIDEPQKKIFDARGLPLPNQASLLTDIFGIIHAEPISAEGNASRVKAGRWIQCAERGVAITDIRGLLKRVEARTLLLYGDRDKAYVKFREGAEAALRNSRTEFVPDSGAFVMQDNPPATATALKRFLENG